MTRGPLPSSPYRAAPRAGPPALLPSERVALGMAAAGWALVILGALAPGLAGVENVGGILGVGAYRAWWWGRGQIARG